MKASERIWIWWRTYRMLRSMGVRRMQAAKEARRFVGYAVKRRKALFEVLVHGSVVMPMPTRREKEV